MTTRKTLRRKRAPVRGKEDATSRAGASVGRLPGCLLDGLSESPGMRRPMNQGEQDPMAADPLTLNIPLSWGLSPLDWHAHAIDISADHLPGVWIARCGHGLLAGTDLHDDPPGHRCASCVWWAR
jgi:hypothetical protein